MTRALSHLLDRGMIGIVIVVCAGSALLLAIVALLARRHRVARDLASLVAALGMAGATASTVALYASARRDLLADTPPWPIELLVRVETALFAAQVTAIAILVAAPLVVAAHALSKRTSRMRFLAAGTVTVLVAGFALLDAHRVLENVSSEWTGTAARYAAVVDDCPRAGGVRTSIVVLGVTLALVAAVRRRHAIATKRRIAGGLGWLAAGSLALWAARPLGDDAEQPIPLWDEEPLDTTLMPPVLPPAPAQCRSSSDFTTVTVSDRIFLDGRPTTSLASDLLAKRSIARALHSKDPVIAIAAAPGVDASETITLVRKLAFSDVATVAQRTMPDFVSASAGRVRRIPRICLVEAP